MKTIVTHKWPHLDEVCAIWLMKRHLPEFGDAKVEFITISDKPLESAPDVIHVGVGLGRFDEHRGLTTASAATLIWDWIKSNNAQPKDEIKEKAVDRIVHFTFLEDTGQMKAMEFGEFSLPAVISGSNQLGDSSATVELGMRLLDALLPVFQDAVKLDMEWQRSIPFDTKWGKGAAFVSDSRGAGSYAYRKGFVLVITQDTKGNTGIRADAKSDADLSKAYERMKELEPEASWYLHHSKKLLLCSSFYNPGVKLSRLSLQQLIEIVKAG